MIKKKFIQQPLLFFLLVPIIAINVWCGFNINRLSSERTAIRNDYDEVNSIKYGLISMEKWMANIRMIATARIDDFTFTPEQEQTLRNEITRILNALLVQADSIVQQDQKTLGRKIRKVAVNAFVNRDNLRSKIPRFTETIVREIKKPDNIAKMKALVQDKIDEYAAQTRDSTVDTLFVSKVLELYKANTIENFNTRTEKQMDDLQRNTYHYTYIILVSLLLFLFMWWLLRNNQPLHKSLFILSAILGLVVLFIGLTSPMIEIDARIQKINFFLIGEKLQFDNQILFYQSKSIWEVVKLLLATGKVDSMLVGILILAFSILFPVSKLISTELYLLGSEKIKQNRFVRFFAFHSSKWSMADVMVVAIFMAYIGFKGILNSQLSGLNFETEAVASIATNKTSLQPGFIIFTAFVLYGLALSEILKRIIHSDEERLQQSNKK